MKKIILMMIVLLAFAGVVNADEFFNVLSGDQNDYSFGLTQISDGYVTAGYSRSYGLPNYEVIISKYDLQGNNTWTKTFGSSGSDYVKSIVSTYDNEMAITGFTYSTFDIFLTKLDNSGSMNWSKKLGGTENYYGRTLIQANDNSFLIAGDSNSDIFLSRIFENGSLDWAKMIGDGNSDVAYGLTETFDNNFVLTGEARYYPEIPVYKFDEDGNNLWTVFVKNDNSYGIGAHSITETIDGGLVLVGRDNYPSTGYDFLIVKLKSDGTLDWSKTLSGSGTEWGESVSATSDDGFIVTGYTSTFGNGDYDILVSKFDSTGDEEWTKVYGGSQHDYGRRVIESGVGYLVTGRTENYGAEGSDSYILKINRNGNIESCSNLNATNVTQGWVTDSNITVYADTFANDTFVNVNVSDWVTTVTDQTPTENKVCYHEWILPLAQSYITNPKTTNFSAVSNISEVENLTLATNYGVISFANRTVNAEAQNYDSNVVFGDCFVAVKSENLDSTFNATAYLLMNNSDGHCGDNTIFTSNDFAADAGVIKTTANICKDCELISDTDDSAVKYRVSHFSSYAIGSNSNMTIDANGPKQVNQTVTFTAVYRNSSSADFISGASCDISLDNGTTATMSEGTSEYTYQTSFTTNGTNTYNITCEATGYQTLKTDDTFTITNPTAQIPEFNTIAILMLLVAVIGIIVYKGKK